MGEFKSAYPYEYTTRTPTRIKVDTESFKLAPSVSSYNDFLS